MKDAKSIVSQMFGLLGVESRGLDDDGKGLLMIGEMQLGLSLTDAALTCDAVVYTFRNPPRVEMLERLRRRAHEFGVCKPGTELECAASRVLLLRRVYRELPGAAELLAQLKALMLDAARFSDEGIRGL